MNYKLNSPEEAIRLGQQATKQDCLDIVKAMQVFDAQYQNLKNQHQDLRNFNTRLKLATWRSLLREALEEAGYADGSLQYNVDISSTGLKCFCNGCENKATVRRTIVDSPLIFYVCLCNYCKDLPERKILDKL